MTFSLYNRFRDLEKVRVDSSAIEGFLGAASTDGVLRTSSPLSYTDGGDYVTLGFTASSVKLDDLGTPDDNTDLDFSITLHGLVPKGTNVGDFLKDDGTWSSVAAGADVKVGVDVGATADFLGAAFNDGALRATQNELTVTDGGNFITLGLADHATARTALGLAIGTDVLAEQTVGISDDNLLEVDGSPNSGEYARFTAAGLEGRTEGEFKSDYSLVIGTNVLAEQTIGIGDDNLVEMDDADAADNDYAKFTANGLEGREYSEVLSDIGALANVSEDATPQLGGDLDLNGKNIDFPSVANVSDCKDEDNMASDSATMLATQQSIKKYVDDSVGAAAGHAILDGSIHTDSVADAVTRGSIIYGNSTPKWDELVVGAADTFLGTDGTDLSYRTAAQVMASLSGEAGAAFSWNSQNLSAIGTVACGAITVADGSGISLQEAVTFTGATTENKIVIPDTLAVALDITEAGNSYLKFATTNGSELVTVGKGLTIVGTTTIAAALTGLIRADSGVLSVDTDVTDLVSAASTTAQGKVELTIASEINTGTSTTLAVTPDSLAGSYAGTKTVILKVFDDATAPTAGNGKMHFVVPVELNGMDLVTVGAHVYTASSGSGPVTVMIHNLTDTSDMLSTAITIDDTEIDSATAGTAAVIDTGEDDVVTADSIRIDVDDIGDSATRGLEIRMGFRLP